MKLGVCTSLKHAGEAAAAGFDYLELSVADDLEPEGDPAAWRERRRALSAAPLPIEAFNSFVRNQKVVGPNADAERLRVYVNGAFQRAAEVGGRILVFGSGGARNVPDGFPRAQAMRQLEAFLKACADASDATGVTLAIEPLHRGESNVINRVSEGAALARRVGRAGVRNLADTWHMEMEAEPLQAIVDSASVLAHVHTADTRRLPPGSGDYDHAGLFATLARAGYDARISIECNWPEGDPEVAFTRARTALVAARDGSPSA
ncbi:MAG: sugar phosphate isomerase/epimerase [Armatimonadetes bacterium]|nr:sugar phosphate isomerase/epimerase [Armatimonadota bacterium]MDE2206303.1 sugar phosphate isomerase/epimerase [Armatimonadota bacterium]